MLDALCFEGLTDFRFRPVVIRISACTDQSGTEWEPFVAKRLLSAERRCGRVADFVVFDCASQAKSAHVHVVHVVQEVSKTALKCAHNDSDVLEMNVVP